MKTRSAAAQISAAAALAMAAATGSAFADNYRVSGSVGVAMGATWTDFESDRPCLCSPYGTDGTAFVFGGQGRINAWFSPDMSAQLDIDAEGTTTIDQYGSDHPGYNEDGRSN